MNMRLKRKDGLDEEILWVAKGDTEITFLDSTTGDKISSAICRTGRCFGLLKRHVMEIKTNSSGSTKSRHHHHSSNYHEKQ